MEMSEHILHRLSSVQDMPVEQLSPEVAYKIIRDKPVNLMKLISDDAPGSYTFPKGTETHLSSKLARVLNCILLDHFDSVEEFRTSFDMPDDWWRDIWTNELRKLKWTRVRSLIKVWDLDINFIYGNSRKPFVPQERGAGKTEVAVTT